MDELLKYDNTFSKELFISKVNNIYVMLCMSIMGNDLKRVDHFISDDVYKKLEEKINSLNEKKLIQMYGELNVANTNIVNIEELEDRFRITVSLTSKYLDYRIDKNSKKIIDGDTEARYIYHNTLVFEKKKNSKELKEVRRCPNCGASMDLNNTGVCQYCNNVFSQDDYDWILVDIKKTL